MGAPELQLGLSPMIRSNSRTCTSRKRTFKAGVDLLAADGTAERFKQLRGKLASIDDPTEQLSAPPPPRLLRLRRALLLRLNILWLDDDTFF